MWNDPNALNRLASFGLLVASLLAAYATLLRIAQLDLFPVREVRVVGQIAHVTRDQVENVIYGQLRGNFFTVNLAEARIKFEKLPWVRRVDVRRRWPDTVEIAIEEHRPLARWGSTGLVNAFGEVFEGAINQKMPVLNGPDGSSLEVVAKYLAFEHTVDGIGRHIEQVRLSERRAWRLHLDDDTVIELGREDAVERLAAFVAAFDRTIARLGARSAYIDLRYANGFAVRVGKLNWDDKRA